MFQKSYRSDTKLVYDLLKFDSFSKFRTESCFYSFLFYNEASGKALGSRDFLERKIYIITSENYFCVGSEEIALRSVLESENIKVQASQSSIFEYLEFKIYFGEKTYFDDIYELAPGSMFEFDQKFGA